MNKTIKLCFIDNLRKIVFNHQFGKFKKSSKKKLIDDIDNSLKHHDVLKDYYKKSKK